MKQETDWPTELDAVCGKPHAVSNLKDEMEGRKYIRGFHEMYDVVKNEDKRNSDELYYRDRRRERMKKTQPIKIKSTLLMIVTGILTNIKTDMMFGVMADGTCPNID